MQMESVLVGAFAVNCLVVWDDAAKAVVIDPGAEAVEIEGALKRNGLTVAAYWLTHGHIDHISALDAILARWPAPVYMHPADAAWAFTSTNQYPPYFRTPHRPDELLDLADGQALEVGGLTARVIHTPGHTPGGVCYYFENQQRLITGDTLFQGSIGRTDLPGGDMATLGRSLAGLLQLPDETRVYPGHGSDSTIGVERRYNPFLINL